MSGAERLVMFWGGVFCCPSVDSCCHCPKDLGTFSPKDPPPGGGACRAPGSAPRSSVRPGLDQCREKAVGTGETVKHKAHFPRLAPPHPLASCPRPVPVLPHIKAGPCSKNMAHGETHTHTHTHTHTRVSWVGLQCQQHISPLFH